MKIAAIILSASLLEILGAILLGSPLLNFTPEPSETLRASSPTGFTFTVNETDTVADDFLEIVITSVYDDPLPSGSSLQFAAFTNPQPVFRLNNVALSGDVFLVRGPAQEDISSRDLRISIQLDAPITLQAGDIISWEAGTFITDPQPVAGLPLPALPEMNHFSSSAYLARNNMKVSENQFINGVSIRPDAAALEPVLIDGDYLIFRMKGEVGRRYHFAVSETLAEDSWSGQGFQFSASHVRNPSIEADQITIYPEEPEIEITLFFNDGAKTKAFFRALP